MTQALRQHPQILFTQTIKRTYKVIKLLGKGTFSIVYQCLNNETKQKLALKIGISEQGQKMLNKEKKIYRQIITMFGNAQRGQSGFAKYYQYGRTERFCYLVLQKLSASIEDLFVKLDHKFTVKTVLNIGIQAIQLIQKVHRLGYVHRDIKPGNFVLGHGNKKDRIYLIDFGLARKSRQNRPQKKQHESYQSQHENYHEPKSFIGTKRFASVASHLGIEQGKKDDLQSLGYTLIFLLKGRLPWQGLKLSNKTQKYETIGQIKQQIDLEQLCKLQIKDQICYQGQAFLKMFRYVRVLNYGDNINYEFLKKLFVEQINMIEKKPTNSGFNRWKCRNKFDWIDETQNEKQKIDRYKRQRDGDRDKQRDRDRQRERERDRDKHRHRDRDRESERDRDRDRKKSKNRQRQRYFK